MRTVREDHSLAALAMTRTIAKHRRWKMSWLLFALFSGTALDAGAMCTFKTNPGGIAFSTFDPSVASTQTASTTASVNCSGAGGTSPSWQFSGANGNAPLQMKHTTLIFFIPYSVAESYVSGPPKNQLWNITATVLGSNYQGAQVGSYSDLLTLTITP